MSHFPDYLFPWVFFLIPITFLLVGRIRYGSFKGAFFGARLLESCGEVPCARNFGVGYRIKVHRLERRDAEQMIGLEIVARGPLSYHMIPLRLEPIEAEKLANLLRDSVSTSRTDNRSVA